MDAWETFVHLFDALDAQYDEAPNAVLGDYLSNMNPFLFAGQGSADPAEFAEFEHDFAKDFPDGQASPELAYAFCCKRLGQETNPLIPSVFAKVTQEDWCDAWEHRKD